MKIYMLWGCWKGYHDSSRTWIEPRKDFLYLFSTRPLAEKKKEQLMGLKAYDSFAIGCEVLRVEG